MPIIEALSTPNPILEVTVRRSPRNPTLIFEQFSHPQIVQWTHFNIDVIRQAYGDILENDLVPRLPGSQAPHAVTGLDDLKGIFKDYVFPSLIQPIQTGAEKPMSRTGGDIPHVNIVKNEKVKQGKTSGLSVMSGTEKNLIVSCVFLETQWKSTDLVTAPFPRDLAAEPLLRVASYCLLANTRYGLILTPGELVVIRVSGTAGDSRRRCLIELQAVPWSASGPNTLTVGIALWFLTMMSLNYQHQMICPQEETHSLNLWWRGQNLPERRYVYRHHLSMREIFELPMGAKYKDTPLHE
ncbi:hypothetical protein FBEOM_6390 [Fusarium beomiforme]|uniref:Uncharacterized protein n=1 Tax=Fusarium beomiforme TaxID=44412 RepID=A0A9P5AJ48_9HYPO|nr:hypothetical protein FBEOM_6390 [Fusarium beomiforme]